MNRRTFLKIAPVGTLAALLAACGNTESPSGTPVPPTPTPDAPSPEFAARRFLELWRADDFDGMYALLTAEAQAATTRADFEARYRGVLAEASVYEFEANLVGAQRFNAAAGGADFDLLYRTRLVGDLQYRPRFDLRLDANKNWRIAWSPALIIPALGATNRLQMFSRTSTRGVIYDRNGQPMATQGAIVTIGVVPGSIQDAGAVANLISQVSGLPPAMSPPNTRASRPNGLCRLWMCPLNRPKPITTR